MEVTCSVAISFMLVACVYGDPPLLITELRMCDPKTHYLHQLSNIKVRLKGDVQELKMKINMSRNAEDDNNYMVGADRVIGTKLKRILNLKNNGACSFLINFAGDTFQGGVKQAKFPHPDRCPLEKVRKLGLRTRKDPLIKPYLGRTGTYNLDWYPINLDAIPSVRLVPKGRFQLIVRSFDSKSAEELFCMVIRVVKN